MKHILTLATFLLMSQWAWAAGDKMQSLVLDFDTGVTELNAKHSKEIDAILKSAALNKKEIDVHMAVWADEDFPGVKKSLNKQQRTIAKNRIKAIKDYIKKTKADVDDMEAYNMAEGSNWFVRVFQLDDFKSAISESTEDDEVYERKYQIYKQKGAPKKAVIVLSLDD